MESGGGSEGRGGTNLHPEPAVKGGRSGGRRARSERLDSAGSFGANVGMGHASRIYGNRTNYTSLYMPRWTLLY